MGDFYRMDWSDSQKDYAVVRVRDMMLHFCILAAKTAVSDLDPPIQEANRKAKPLVKNSRRNKKTIDAVLADVNDQLEPDFKTMRYLEEWLKSYIPKWRRSAARKIRTPREEFICWHEQLDMELLDWRLYVTEAEGSGLVYGDDPVPAHVAPDDPDPIRGSEEYYVYKNDRGDVLHRFPANSIMIGSR
jgi:hypothetical protein